MTRISWDSYFLDIATAVAARAACSRSQVGAVLVMDNRIVSTGYNGTPAGDTHCIDGGCPRGKYTYDELPPGGSYSTCTGLHAEMNCLAYSTAPRGGTMYVTREPCEMCAKILKAYGIERVVYPDA